MGPKYIWVRIDCISSSSNCNICVFITTLCSFYPILSRMYVSISHFSHVYILLLYTSILHKQFSRLFPRPFEWPGVCQTKEKISCDPLALCPYKQINTRCVQAVVAQYIIVVAQLALSYKTDLYSKCRDPKQFSSHTIHISKSISNHHWGSKWCYK